MSTATTALMAEARSGRAEALGKLCEIYGDYLRTIARVGLGPSLRKRVELGDVVQEAFVEVVRQFPRFHGETEAALVGWMRRLVDEKLADLGRHYTRLKRGGGQLPLPLETSWIGSLGSKDQLHASPSEAASHRELSSILLVALGSLPHTEAEVVWLHHVEGLSFRTIGSRLGLSAKSIRRFCAKGLRSLRREIDGPPGGSLYYRESDSTYNAPRLPRLASGQ
jgi:RNA polymerase sigma-70 factor, ECF subfamily